MAKKTKTTKKKTKITKSKPTALQTVKKQSLIEEIKPIKQVVPTTSVVKRLPVEICAEMFDLLQYAFQPEGFYDEDDEFFTDDRFLAMWKSFLICAGYFSEDEYWSALDKMPHDDKCEKCKAESEEEEKKIAEEKAKNVN